MTMRPLSRISLQRILYPDVMPVIQQILQVICFHVLFQQLHVIQRACSEFFIIVAVIYNCSRYI
jgi:hypothetical protein